MSSILIALIVFACLTGGAIFGMLLRSVLPRSHLDDNSKDVVRVSMGLVATIAALVLGLLVASAKSSYDTKIDAFNKLSAEVVLLDIVLEQFGPETKEARDLLRRGAISLLERNWSPNASELSKPDNPAATTERNALYRSIQGLAPQNDMQRRLQAQALEIGTNLLSVRLLSAAQEEGSTIPMPFMLVMVFWLAVLLASFALFAPPNATVNAAILVCGLSVSGAIFLVLELARPYDGVIQISSAPLRNAIAQLGQ